MDEALKVVAIIALISITIVSIYGVVFLNKATKTISDVSNNLNSAAEHFSVLKTRLMLTLDEVSEAKKEFSEIKNNAVEHLEKWKETSAKADNLLDNVNSGANKIIHSLEPYERLMNRSYNKIAPPIDKAATLVSAVSKAIEAFGSKLRSR